MSKFEHLEGLFDAMYLEALEVVAETEKVFQEQLQCLLDKVRQDVEEYEASGILPMDGFKSVKAAEAVIDDNTRGRPQRRTTASNRTNSIKENNSELANQVEPQKSTRRTRLTSLKSNPPAMIKVSDKVVVKMERITENFNDTQTISSKNLDKVKKEAEDMPPPSYRPQKRTRARKTTQISNSSSNIDLDSIIIKQEVIDNHPANRLARESDVVVQTSNVLNITIDDSDEEGSAKVKPSRTRTKKRRLSNTEVSASEVSKNNVEKQRLEVGGAVRSTRTRTKNTNNDQQVLKELQVVLDNTVIINKNNLDNTVVIEKKKANETFVVDKQAAIEQEKQLLTDDEDIIDNSVKETKGARKKQMFSPYAGSPVKKRVAAFEKLGVVQGENYSHSTRAKTKKLVENTASVEDDTPPNNDKKKIGGIPKLRTPIVENRILPHPTSSVDRHQTNTTNSLAKSKSALKASQAEFRERELRRQQKEAEAPLKKDALITAQAEEKRRRNEERRLKAQQQRDAFEKEKQQQLEAAEIAKINKAKLLLAEKDAKLLAQKENANKKRQLVLKKAALEKQKEEQHKLEEEKQKTREVPKNVPLLPTPDCYDSDDSTNANRRIEKPAWQNSRFLYIAQKKIINIGEMKKKLFSCRPRYPDIHKIFPGSKPVKRNSSVIWDTSNVSKHPSMIEEEED